MNINDLKKLKRKLPVGATVKIASKLDLSVSYVSYVLNGKRTNDDVIEYAIELVKDKNQKSENLKNEISNLK